MKKVFIVVGMLSASASLFGMQQGAANLEECDNPLSKRLQNALDFQSKDNNTPLRVAIKKENTELAKCLIDLGTDVNKKGGLLREDPLYFAVKSGNRDMVNYLAELGACDRDAVILAAIKGIFFDESDNCKDILDWQTKEYINFDIIKREVVDLFCYGPDVAYRQEVILDIFKKNNANYDARNSEAEEFLSHLIGEYTCMDDFIKSDMVEWLLKKGANPNTVADSDGNTLLMVAVKKLQTRVVRHLIDYGADIYATNSSARTAYDLAKEEKERIQREYSSGLSVSNKITLEEITEIVRAIEKKIYENGIMNKYFGWILKKVISMK